MREAVGVRLESRSHCGPRECRRGDRDTVALRGAVSFSGKDATVARQRASACFEETFDAWFDRVYADSTLTLNAAQVQTALTNLRAPGATPPDETLEDLATRIDALAIQVETADHGWAGARGKELVPGLSAMFDTAQHLRLIGDAPVQSVLAHEQAEQNAFAARWLANGNLPSVLSASPTSGLQLAADLSPLRDAVRTFLAQPFAAASGDGGAAIRTVDAGSVQRALAVLPAYRQYVGGPLAQAPDAYRAALMAAAGNDAVHSMVERACRAGPRCPCSATAAARPRMRRCSSTRRARARRPTRRISIRSAATIRPTSVVLHVSDAAVAVVRATDDATADARAVPSGARRFPPAGTAAPAGRCARSARRRRRRCKAISPRKRRRWRIRRRAPPGALDWLNAQKQPLEPADAQLVSRWRALSVDLAQYRAKSPASAMIAVPSIIADQLDKLDVDNCSVSLAQIDVPERVTSS